MGWFTEAWGAHGTERRAAGRDPDRGLLQDRGRAVRDDDAGRPRRRGDQGGGPADRGRHPHLDTAGPGRHRDVLPEHQPQQALRRLDLRDPADAELGRELARRADVFIENFKTGGLARYGLDHDSVRAANPGVVYTSISGFGWQPAPTCPATT